MLVTFFTLHAAYAVSSNYNFPPGFASGFDSIQTALAMITTGKDLDCEYSGLERDLIEALATRSSAETKATADPAEMNFGDSCSMFFV